MINNLVKNKTFLLTGGAGFIGSSMSLKLLKLGAKKVVVIDNLSTGKEENIKACREYDNFVFILGDANKYNDLGKIFKENKIDYVLHYASTVGVKRTLENPFLVFEDIEGIKNILELSKIHNVKKALFASSSEVYGETDDIPEIEDKTAMNSRLPYAIVKLLGESYFKTYFEVHKLPTVSLRFFNVFGPGQESSGYGFVTAIFINQVLNNERPTVFGDGLQTRDFIYIEDNLEATLRALFNEKVNGTEINIGTGKERTILDLANKIIEVSGKDLKPIFLPPRRKGDMARRCPDVTKMKKLLGYTSQFSLTEGLKKTIRVYENDK